MPEIPSIGHGAVGPVNRAAIPSPYQGATRNHEVNNRAGDRVELSEHARLLDRLRHLPEARTELVEAVKKAIDDGTYDTPQKLEIALDRFIEDP